MHENTTYAGMTVTVKICRARDLCIYKAIGRYMGIRGDTRGSGSCERCTPMYVYSPILIFRGRLLRGEYKPFKVIVSQDFMNFFFEFVCKHAILYS
jgi:hypothetical protein